MAKTQTAEVLLKYSVDSASANRVRQSFAELEYGLSDLRSELTGMGSSAQAGIANLRTRFVQGEQSVVAMQDEVEELRRDLLALDDVNVTPKVNMPGGGGADGLATVDRFGRFGTQFAGAFGASGSVGNVVGFIGDVADSLVTLGPAGGAAAVGIGAVSLALAKFTSDAEDAARRVERAIAGESAAERLVATGSRVEQEARRVEVLQELKLAQEQLTERQIELLNYTNSLGVAQAAVAAGMAEMNIILGEDAATIEAYTNEIDNQQGIIEQLTSEFIELNARLSETPSKLVEMTGKLTIMLSEVAKISKGVKGVAETGIQGGLPTGVAARRDAQAAQYAALMTTRSGAYLDSITRTVQAQESLTKAQNAYDEAVRASGARMTEIGAKLQADLSEAEADRQRDLAQAAEEAGEQRVKITEEAEKERARIQKRFDRSFAQAVGDRDALAAKRAEEQRKDELEQLDDRYTDQNKAVDDSLKKQQKIIDDRYKAQVATVNAAAQAAVRAEQAAAQARISALQQGVQAAQVALVNAQQAEFLTRANFYNQSLSQAQIWSNLMQLYTSYGFSIPTGAGRSGGGGIGGRTLPTPMATGGPVIAGRPYVVGDGGGPELFVPSTNGRIIPHGAAFTINVTGAQSDTIRAVSRQQALNAFDGILRQMGVA